jgi:hypothetical protein
MARRLRIFPVTESRSRASSPNGSEPMLAYASTFAIFDQYFYEFEKGRWIYMAD